MSHGGNVPFITITGQPGSGKTFLETRILEARPDIRMFEGRSYTTRFPRPGDLPGEYEHVTRKEFRKMRANAEFAWVFPHGDYHVATRKRDLTEAMRSGKVWMMTLVPEAVARLTAFVGKESLVSFYLEAPEEQMISRIRERGDDMEKALKRFEDTRSWKRQMHVLGLEFFPIDTSDEDPPAKTALSAVLRVLSLHGI
ncbi:hypothetical protein KW796_00375 [Candidatus Parcubacteria bacterium]|nr:hypothetical protein [Candidatus Parcubacteria bacterium]